MQIKQIVPASPTVAAQTSFFTNMAIPAEQILAKLTYRIGGAVLVGGAISEDLPQIAAVEVPGIQGAGVLTTRLVARFSGTGTTVDLSAASTVSIQLWDTSGSPAQISSANLFQSASADPAVLNASGFVQQNAVLAPLAPAQSNRVDNVRVRLVAGAGTIAAQTLPGDLSVEVYLIGLPLQ